MNDPCLQPQTNLVHEIANTTTESAVVGVDVITRTDINEQRTYATTLATSPTPLFCQVTTTDSRWRQSGLQNSGNASWSPLQSQYHNQTYYPVSNTPFNPCAFPNQMNCDIHPFLNYKPPHLANPDTMVVLPLDAFMNMSLSPANCPCSPSPPPPHPVQHSNILSSLPPTSQDYFAYLAMEQFPNYTTAHVDMCLPNNMQSEPMDITYSGHNTGDRRKQVTYTMSAATSTTDIQSQGRPFSSLLEQNRQQYESKETQTALTEAEKEENRKQMADELKECLLNEAEILLKKKDEGSRKSKVVKKKSFLAEKKRNK